MWHSTCCCCCCCCLSSCTADASELSMQRSTGCCQLVTQQPLLKLNPLQPAPVHCTAQHRSVQLHQCTDPSGPSPHCHGRLFNAGQQQIRVLPCPHLGTSPHLHPPAGSHTHWLSSAPLLCMALQNSPTSHIGTSHISTSHIGTSHYASAKQQVYAQGCMRPLQGPRSTARMHARHDNALSHTCQQTLHAIQLPCAGFTPPQGSAAAYMRPSDVP
jgi:hypothetical protein